jgi:hypothetical protein
MKQKLTLLASFLGLLTFAQSGSEQVTQENPDLGAQVKLSVFDVRLENRANLKQSGATNPPQAEFS